MLKLEIIGNLGADAQEKSFGDGSKAITFNVAHTEKYDGREETVWVSVFLDARRDKVAQFLTKGTKVFIRGRVWLRIYDSAKYHKKMAGFSMWADELELCGGGRSEDDKEDSGQQGEWEELMQQAEEEQS